MPWNFVVKRVALFLIVIWAAASVNFFVPRLGTGRDPIREKLGQLAASGGVSAVRFRVAEQRVLLSAKDRRGAGRWFAGGVATFGLLATRLGCLRLRPDALPHAVGLFITAGYWFTSSTSFANPAVTMPPGELI